MYLCWVYDSRGIVFGYHAYCIKQTQASLTCLDIKCSTSQAKHTGMIKRHDSKHGIKDNLFVLPQAIVAFPMGKMLISFGRIFQLGPFY